MQSQTSNSQRRLLRLNVFSLTILSVGGGLNLYRGFQALRQMNALKALPAEQYMQHLAISSLVWGIVFTGFGLGLWHRRRWAWIGVQIVVALYHVHIWVDHFFVISDYARQMWPLAAANSAVVLLLVWGFLYIPSIRTVYSVPATRDR